MKKILLNRMKILALGVDDSEGQRNIAVSLFDVTDPYEAKMLERVRLGGNYSWSEANWEPKALTVDETHNILIVPFNSYDTETWESTAGLQMVSFDLEEGDLELKGHVYGRYSIERTRVVGDWILATSFKSLQVVDIGNLDEPRVEKVLDLCVNVKDIVPSGDLYIQPVQDWYDGKVVLRTVRGPDDLNALDSEMLGSNWARLFDLPTGPVLAANVPEDGKTVGKLFAIDVGVDGKIDLRELGRLKNGINFRDNHYNYYWYGGYYYDDVMLDVEGRCSEVPGYPMRDSDNFHVLGNTLVYYHVGDHPYMNWVYHEKYGRYAPRSEGPGNDTLFTFDLGDHSDVPAPGTAVIEAYSFRGMASHGDHLYIHHRMNGVELYNRTVKDKYGNYSYEYLDYEYFYRNYVLEIDLSDPSGPVIVDDYNIPGELIGAGEGVIFTMSEWNMNGEDNVTLNTLSLHDGRAEILTAVNLGPGPVEAVVYGDRAYIVSGQDQYYYYYYPRYGGDGGNITVRVLDLSEPETPGILASLSIEGNMELQCLDERHMCLFDRGESELVVYSIEDLPELEFTTMLRIRDRGDVRLYEDSIYVMQGYYGVLSAGL